MKNVFSLAQQKILLVAIFICGLIIFNWPFISIIDHGTTAITFYTFFLLWFGIIAAVFFITRRIRNFPEDAD